MACYYYLYRRGNHGANTRDRISLELSYKLGLEDRGRATIGQKCTIVLAL